MTVLSLATWAGVQHGREVHARRLARHQVHAGVRSPRPQGLRVIGQDSKQSSTVLVVDLGWRGRPLADQSWDRHLLDSKESVRPTSRSPYGLDDLPVLGRVVSVQDGELGVGPVELTLD